MSDDTPDSTTDLRRTLGLDVPADGHRHLHVWLIGAVLLALAGLTVAYLTAGDDEAVRFRTSDAQIGDLTVLVTATGQLKPVNQVDVGTEVSGTIESVAVDYNDRVSAGQVLARLDTAKLEAQVLQSKASLASARAKVNEMEATVVETRLKSERCKRLSEKSLCSREDLDAAQAASLRAQAEAADARARVAEAAAKLRLDETDLGKAVIRAPIDAIVLDTARSREIMELLGGFNRDLGITIVMVTHDATMATYARRIVRCIDGRIAADARNGEAA